MTEVKRYTFTGAAGLYIYSVDYERLVSENAALQQRLNAADQRVDDLESDLIKARELSPVNWTDRQVLDFLGVALRNVDLVGEVRLSEIRQGFQYMRERQAANPITPNVDESCGQDAEAAKCARCDAPTVESCDEKGCGFLGAGNGAPAAKREHCSTCSKLNGSNYCDCGQE